MKKGQIYEGVIQRVGFPNKGSMQVTDVATGESVPVMVKNAIPGQKVRVQIVKKRKGKAEGMVQEILARAPEEIASPCPHFGACGGCNYQVLPYEAQLRLKEAQVRELIGGFLSKDSQWEGIKASPNQYGYRNKMEYTFGDEYRDGPLSLGMHKRGAFHDIVPVTNCQIVEEDFCKILAATLTFFRACEAPYLHRMRHTGYLRHLLVRKGVKTGEILVDLVTAKPDDLREVPQPGTDDSLLMGPSGVDSNTQERWLAGWVQKLQDLPLDGKLTGILHTYNDSLADVIRNDATRILSGQDFFYEELLGLRFQITPFSFFQTNSRGAEVLYQVVRDYSGETRDKVLYDLYSGTGTIAQILAPVAKQVVGVEIVEEAVQAARENAALNGLSNCTFRVGDVLKVIDEVAAANQAPDLIVLDPPRDGIHPKALEKIIAFGVPKMVYVSCKPTSLARDLEILQAHGYRVVRGCCVDMFPGCVHVETVVLLSRTEGTKRVGEPLRT